MSRTQIIEEGQEREGSIILGEGTFGKVYKKYEKNQWVAIKRISKSLVQRYGRQQQLLREIQIMKRIKHNNIVKFISFDEDQTGYYQLKMEYCQGQNLKQFFGSKKYRSTIASDNLAAKTFATRVSLDCIDALVEVRTHMIINRDIKLDNIMVDFSQNGYPSAKMIDFGEAKFNIKQAMTRVGTRGYMAPEIYEGSATYTEACDCWSLGQTFYQMFEGVRLERLEEIRFSSPFKQNFYPCQQIQFHQFYNKIIFEPMCLNKKRTPAPFRDIIRGFLKPDPEERISIQKMLQILINKFQCLCQLFSSQEQRQYQLIRLIDCLSKQKETMFRKTQMNNNLLKIEQIYTKLFIPFAEVISEDKYGQPFQVAKLMLRIIDKINENIDQILLQINIKRDEAFEEIFKQILDREKYEQLDDYGKGYVNYYLRQQRIIIDGNFTHISAQIIAFIRNHFPDKFDQTVNLINKLLQN